jgi:hypothetical protein
MDDRRSGQGAVVDFLRREAPGELDRLCSISELVLSHSESDPSRSDARHPSYAAWLRETFGMFCPGVP